MCYQLQCKGKRETGEKEGMIVLPAIVQTMVTALFTRAEVLSGAMVSTVLALTEGTWHVELA